MRSITLTDQTAPIPTPVTEKTGIDLQDVLLVLGFLSLEVGVSLIFIPAALIVAGILLLFVGTSLHRAKPVVKR